MGRSTNSLWPSPWWTAQKKISDLWEDVPTHLEKIFEIHNDDVSTESQDLDVVRSSSLVQNLQFLHPNLGLHPGPRIHVTLLITLLLHYITCFHYILNKLWPGSFVKCRSCTHLFLQSRCQAIPVSKAYLTFTRCVACSKTNVGLKRRSQRNDSNC